MSSWIKGILIIVLIVILVSQPVIADENKNENVLKPLVVESSDDCKLFCGLIFRDVNFFATFMIGLGGIIGVFSKKLSISEFGGMLIFVEVAVKTDLFIFSSLLYVFLVIFLFIMGFRVWNYTNGNNMGEI